MKIQGSLKDLDYLVFGNYKKFGVGYCMKFGKQNIHTSKTFLVNLLGDYC